MKRDFILSRYGKVDPLTLGAIGSLASSAFAGVGGAAGLTAAGTLASAGLGAAALAGAGGQSGGGSTPQAAPSSAPAPAPGQLAPVGTRGGSGDTRQPTFVGASSVPQQSGYGQKTLLGQ